MKITAIIIFIQLLTGGITLFAGEGADRKGMSFVLAYNGAWLNYQENSPNGNFLDRDNGWLSGIFIEARFDGRDFFIRADFNVVFSDIALYTGSLQNGTPVTSCTRELIYNVNIDSGYKLFSLSTATFSAYIGFGYRNWERGEDYGSNYKEAYYWGFCAVGINIDFKIGNYNVGLDAALLIPFNPQMQTNVGGRCDMAIFSLVTQPGLKIEIPFSYIFFSNNSVKLFAFISSFYERWNLGQSPSIILTQNGTPITWAFEPTSFTDFPGLRLGIGISF